MERIDYIAPKNIIYVINRQGKGYVEEIKKVILLL